MIWVTTKDGSRLALNIDRIERVELNPISPTKESNIFFVGGGRLTVAEPPEKIVEEIMESKAQTIALSLSMSTYLDKNTNLVDIPKLHVFHPEEPTP